MVKEAAATKTMVVVVVVMVAVAAAVIAQSPQAERSGHERMVQGKPLWRLEEDRPKGGLQKAHHKETDRVAK
jgi:uncharacterized protein YpuA (DUF1002 family)